MSLLTNSLLLVLREILEAAVLLGLLWNYTNFRQLSMRWLWWATPIALGLSFLYATNLGTVTDLFDGSGQELLSAALHVLVYFPVLVLLAGIYGGLSSRLAEKIMSLVLIAAAVREGSEILIYLGAFTQLEAQRNMVWLGAFIGAGIGISAGVLVSALIHNLSRPIAILLVGVLLSFVASGMMMQGVSLLDQVGLLPYSSSVYSTEWLISERSILGQLLYAVFGYDSEPTRIQMALYLTCLALALALLFNADKVHWGRDETPQ